MRKFVKMFRDWFANKLGILPKEISMSILGFFFLFIAIYFSFNMQANKYFLFFVWSFGILTFLYFVPLIKLGFNSKNEIISYDVENSKELKKINVSNFKENEFSDFFWGNSFDDFKNISLKNNLITKDGCWLFARKRDISLLIAVLVENGLIKSQNNYKRFHGFCEKYFDSTFDYSEMTTVINDVLENDIQKRDVVIYNQFNVFYDIKL